MRAFGPVYLITASLGLVLVWYGAPRFRDRVRPDLRDKWARLAAVVKGVDQALLDAPLAPDDVTAAARAMPEGEEDAAPGGSDWDSVSVVVEDEAAEPAPAGGSAGEAQNDPLPSSRGIRQADWRDAAWGVVNDAAPYRAIADGEVLGKAAAGSVFIISQRQRGTDGTMEFVGNFRSRPATEPVIIAAARLCAFTGSFDDLSRGQRSALSSYYSLRGQAEQIRRDIVRANGEKSPHFAQAVAAKRQWDEMSARVERLSVQLRTDEAADAAAIRDELAELKNKMAVLKGKVVDFSSRHKAWKAEHAAQLADPEADPQYRQLQSRMTALAKTVPGLAF